MSFGNYISIVIGGSRNFYVDLLYPDSRETLDLTDYVEITASLPAADGTVVALDTGTGVSVLGTPGQGRIALDLSDDVTKDLLPNPAPGTFQDLQVEVEYLNGDKIITVLTQVLNIIEPAFPVV